MSTEEKQVKTEEAVFDPGSQEEQKDDTSQPLLKKKEKEAEHILEMSETQIQDVWESNFEEELWKIIELTQRFNVIAMDTEFPGINKIPQGRIDEKDFEYQLIKENVRTQKIIQIGISIADEQGNVPTGISTWQFNFKFDEDNDVISEDSKNLLKNAGIDFNKFKNEGLDSRYFSEWVLGSDIVLNDDIIWVAFHGGFDFGYFLQMLYGSIVPDNVEQFYQLLKLFFPRIYDLKYIIKDSSVLKDCGLQKLASELKVERIGPQHQAGSDSLLTLATYFKLRDSPLISSEPSAFERGQNVIYGLGKGFLGVKDRDYLWNYKMISLSNQEYNHEMHMPYGYHQQPIYFMEPSFQMNPQQMTEYQTNMHQQQFMHPNYWQMQMNQQYHMMQDDQMVQQQQQQVNHHNNNKDNYGRKKNQNQF